MDKKEEIEFFLIEASNTYDTKRVYEFFNKRSIKIVGIDLEKKGDKFTSYKVNYVYSPDVIISLEVIKKDKLYEKEDFKITKLSIRNNFKEIVEKKIMDIKNTKLISYPVKYEDNINIHFIKQVGAVGLEFINEEIMNKQRSVLSYMIKNVGTNIFNGKSIMNVSLPIYISDYRSQVENFAYGAKNHHQFLEKAVDASNLERIKLVTTGFIAGLHFGLTMGKPFNPILGETFQCKVGNTMCYAEQTSHHPPVTNFLIVNPGYTQSGHIGMEANANPNTMTGKLKGKIDLKFNDGTQYGFSFPDFQLTGIMMGRRYINWVGAFRVDDITNGITSYLKINPDERSFFGKLFSKDTFPDYFNGFICYTSDLVYDKKKNVYNCDKNHMLAKLEGEWSRFMNINDVCYWNQEEQDLLEMERQEFTAPSDAHFRDDLILYKMGLNDQAQEAKVYLEEQQRRDRKLREGVVE